MKVLLIYPNIVESPKDISFGLAIISSLLKKNNHKVKLIDTSFEKPNIAKIMQDYDPEFVGVSAASNDLSNAINICKEIKKIKNIPIICGGYHATIAPEDILKEDCFDASAIGEAELSFLELVNQFEKTKELDKTLLNFHFKNKKNEISNLNQDLDALPFADREIFDYQRYINHNRGLATFITSKGCPYVCSYCINKVLMDKYKNKGKFLRFRSIDNVLKEIKEVILKYKVKEIEFYDDTFTLDKKRIKEFSQKYPLEIGLPFYINARVNAVAKEDFVLLKKAGCVRVSIGIESGDPEIRNNVLKRNQTDDQIINTFKWAKEAGLQTYSFNMIGIPQETKESINKTIKLNEIIQPDFVGVSIFNAFKGTELFNYCQENNLLRKENSKSYFQSSNVIHPLFSMQELKKMRDSFGFKVYKKTRTKRAYIDLIDKKFARYKLYNQLRSFLIERGIKKII